MSTEFTKAKAVLSQIAKAEEAIHRHMRRRCDWDDSEDVNEYRRSERGLRRKETIARLCPNGRCPSCGRVVFSRRSWVITKAEDLAVCRRCFTTKLGREVNLKAEGYLDIEIFGEPTVRYLIDGFKLAVAREMTGLGVTEFARRAGWSHTYQIFLETGRTQTISLENAETILQVLEETGNKTKDSL